MSKTKEELTQLKTEYETLNNKLKELTEEELKLVIGGHSAYDGFCPYHDHINYYKCDRPLKGSKQTCLVNCKTLADGCHTPVKHDHP